MFVNSAKPFLKWAGGKKQLISEIEKYYPFKDKSIKKYVEPFIGGGAILFDILNKYELEEIYISDINKELINTYEVIKNNLEYLLILLRQYQEEYENISDDFRKKYYEEKRKLFNELKKIENTDRKIERASLFIFLNKTCFNGLYRENKEGYFNVPIGKYKNPLICDEKNLKTISNKLKKVNINLGSYENSIDFIDKETFVYLDPPYRPLTKTSNFTSYTKFEFADNEQIKLSKYFQMIDKKGAKVLLSNSDPKNYDENDNFFEILYNGYKIKRIFATRMINSKAENRKKITELLISNF